jgi:hypothetical protein
MLSRGVIHHLVFEVTKKRCAAARRRASFVSGGLLAGLMLLRCAAATSEDHWSFRAPVRPKLPSVQKESWARNPIDRFILARLEKEGLPPSPEADRRTLIRRLYFTVTGLPPSPEEVESFLRDRSDGAYETLVNRLLDSPHYGERWARHWLDVVRFAESNGFETNTERPRAWPYRDYVIRAFNEDLPYDRFLFEQIAGDSAGVDEATGFLVGGPWDAVKSPDVNLTLQQRMDELHDMISTTATAFLGLTVGCARCHNHKFDPISQKDYYAIQAVFAGVQHGERERRTPDYPERMKKAAEVRRKLAVLEEKLAEFIPLAHPDNAADGKKALRPPVNSERNVERFSPVEARFVRFTVLATNGGEPCIDELEVFTTGPSATNVALASFGTTATASGTYPNSELHRLEHINDGRYGNSRSWISSENGRGWVQLEFPGLEKIDRIVWARDREGKFRDRLATRYRIEAATEAAESGDWRTVASSDDRIEYSAGAALAPPYSAAGLDPARAEVFNRLLREKEGLEKELKQWTAADMVYAGRFEQPGPTYRLNRGEPMQKREQVSPGVITGLGHLVELSADTPEQARRVALAKWIADPGNPLTARVMVNRIWQHSFAEGIVRTPSDFGHMGATPSHPELLDWLAVEFIESGWSVKHIQRLILLSATFRQSSRATAHALELDGATGLLWRYPPHRLEAEPLRDTILAVSGTLDLRMGGPGFDLFEPNNNYVKVYNPKREFGPPEFRRMIYQARPRMRLDDTFGAFDCPDAGQVAPKRNVSTTPLQALALLNSPFILQQARFFAERVEREAGGDSDAQAVRAFEIAFNREPQPDERAAAGSLVEKEGLATLCRALFNANEFLYVF